ncbi:flavin monoamine oxidase family protein [Alkalibacillus haloalkaliphilus]|uniref:flavin monoamine oxidase family protein n=1 Tax=Alkalibacillus haloalkaliphilus TaxID=94136 RepID=UPI0029356A5D|nr:flavin monoamine oxidase family protein [Alkalibacillus haloalkaliphilus]MDV2581409.1 flavin monoamine oxidase family protein [Alkalibacillus haloalkaliphilus]
MKQTYSYNHRSLSYPNDMLSIIRTGLSQTINPKRIVIIGAGMAGLVSASLLKAAGHTVTILEGNDRVVGRIYTIREPFSHGLYFDAGAMRFPNTHELLFEYINKFIGETELYHVNGVQVTADYYRENPGALNFPFAPHEEGKTAHELLASAVSPVLNLFEKAGPEEQNRLKQQFDHYSFDNFLIFNPVGPSLSPEAIRKVKVLLGVEGFPELSFVSILFDIVQPIFEEELEFYEVLGGNDCLPYSFLPQLKENIFYNQKVHQITQNEDGVSVIARDQSTNTYYSFEGDYTIVTIPYSVLQFIDIDPHESFSFHKWKALRELNYVSSVKVGLEFETKFWEKAQIRNVISDLPFRQTYGGPSHNIGGAGPGILLASYCWGSNADLWSALPEEERIHKVLQQLFKIYGDEVYREFSRGASYSWGHNQFSGGCFTLFAPNQFSDFSDHLHLPEGRVHFAGEHTSAFHGWVEGAIESGIRAAHEVNERVD